MKVTELEHLIDRIVKAERLAESRNASMMDAMRVQNDERARAQDYISAANLLSQKLNESDRVIAKQSSAIESLYLALCDVRDNVKDDEPAMWEAIDKALAEAALVRGAA